jgi:hypothetical protein
MNRLRQRPIDELGLHRFLIELCHQGSVIGQ